MPDALPPWRPLLRSAREREGRSPQARWLQLATVAADGTPRVRTLVFRGWAGSTALDLLTDGRSAKPVELVRQPAVELCWLLPRARSQFRLRGSLQTLSLEQVQKERERHWQMLSPIGRALWGWPPPGEPFDPEATFPEQLPPVLEGEQGVGGGEPESLKAGNALAAQLRQLQGVQLRP